MTSGFSELLRSSDAALRSDPSRANRLLREVQTHWINQDVDDRRRVTLNVLDACAYEGLGALRPGEVAKLLIPLLILLPSDEDVTEYKPVLEAIARREGMERSPIVLEALEQRGISTKAADSPAHEVATARANEERSTSVDPATDQFMDALSTGLPRIGEFPADTSLEAVSHAWWRRRAKSDKSQRLAVDCWIIRSALLSRQRLDLGYCDELRSDEEFWASQEASDLAGALTAPISGAIGDLQAVCLNSRIRFLRPRLFLQNPDTLVIAPLASRAGLTDARDVLFEEVSYPFLRSIRVLQHERRRARSPRVSVLDDVERYLQDVLRRFGLRLLHQSGEHVQFDPTFHMSALPIERGETVIVLEPGLEDLTSGQIRLPATVTKLQLDDGYSRDEEEGNE